MHILPFVAYLIAGALYAAHFSGRSLAVGRTATTLLIFGALVAAALAAGWLMYPFPL